MPRLGLDRPEIRRLGSRLRRAAAQLRNVVEDARLRSEQRRLVLGPAHLAWSANSVEVNRDRWDHWDWARAGEEWTASPEWKQSLIDDVLLRLIPDRAVVLEIGPGAGRWSRALLPRAERLILADLSARPLELCRAEFAGSANVEYVLSSGSDLPGVADACVDALWSFDVFVHIAPADQDGYLRAIARVLAPGALAAIHHADGRNRGRLPSRHGWRAPMSRGLFADLARQHGLALERHVDSWGPSAEFDLSAYADVISVLRKPAQPNHA
jgi:SAM-dependent methyltransferase